MQIVLRCKCGKMTVSEKDDDVCMEIDFLEGELKFICRHCKKENKIKLINNPSHEPLPKISVSRY